jgi:hypothetical protein
VIERLLIAMLGGKTEEVLELLHPQAEWSPTVWSGEEEVYRGREGVKRWLDQFGPGLEHLDLRIEQVRVEEERGAVLGTVFDSRDEGMFAARIAWSFELEDGLLRRGCAHETWDEAVRAAGLG